MVATNDDLLVELKKIRKLIKGTYGNQDVANQELSKEE